MMRVAPVLGLLGSIVTGAACGSFSSADGVPPAAGDASVSLDGSAGDGDTTESFDAGGDAPSTLGDGLLGHWKLDDVGDVAKDELELNPGQRVGGSWTTGHIAGAFATGGTGYVRVPWTPQLTAPDRFSLSVWLNLDMKVDSDSYVFTHGSSFYVKLNSRYPQISMSGGYYNVTREVPAGGWHHLAVTFDAGVPAIWVDGFEGGAREAKMPPTTRPAGGDDPIRIGCDNGGLTCAVGLVDDLRFYSRVLTVAEIKALAAQ